MKKIKKLKIKFKPEKLTKNLLETLRDRDKYVLESRYGLNEHNKKTLESIGKEFKITRERVRQIQDAALKVIKKSSSYQEAKDIFIEIEDIIHGFGGVVNEKDLLESFSENKVTQNHFHFHLVVGDNFKKHKEDEKFRSRWSVNGEIADKVHMALENLKLGIGEDELINEEHLILRLLDHLDGVDDGYISNDIARDFLGISKSIGKNPLGNWGLSSSQNVSVRGIQDYAYLVMKENGSPLHFREVSKAINETFNKKAHPATTHNELIKDDRFVLVGRGLYGLKEWGYRAGVVKDVIKGLIEEKGPMTKDEIVEYVFKERYLKENTILVNLSNKNYFKKNEDGRYELASELKSETRKPSVKKKIVKKTTKQKAKVTKKKVKK